ncbi:MAG: tRNA pseudouridine(55) synthase TruB [Deltaproteobacteria bacterium]|nr:tRNA pseudouridine(55) synthase TruB [Deltaproteobacteria bacterium]
MSGTLHGVLVVDKPAGLSSHDVVSRVRRVAGQRGVGHAGTLDPMATGVLVVLLGEGTKLASHLTSDDKIYQAEITLGSETDTLDAEGEVTARAEVPVLSAESVRRAAELFLGAQDQRAPVVSALKLRGTSLHERYRRGEAVEAPIRRVHMHWLEFLGYRAPVAALRVGVAKGYYVRSLARDLGLALGTRAHLSSLRRLGSGSLSLDGAVPLDALLEPEGRARLEAALLPLEAAVGHLPQARLVARGAEDAFHGRAVRPADYTLRGRLSQGELAAMLGPDGRLLALGKLQPNGALRVARGFRYG